MSNRISGILVGLLLFSAFVTGFHHHLDNESHANCLICIASSHSPAVADNGSNFFHREIVLPFEAPEKVFYLSLPGKATSPSRAPPTEAVLS
ncbi:MAG: hypothetical protein AABY54_02505 [Deltaproteobacteria bacterium]